MKEPSTSEILELKKKLEDNPDSPIFVSLADAYRKEGSFDEARKVCLKGLEKNPDHWNAHFILGRIYQDESKPKDAVKQFQKVLELDPENQMAHSFLGTLFMKLEDYKAAIDEYQAVLTINPDDDEAQNFLKTAIEKASSAAKGVTAKETSEPVVDSKADANMASITMAELYLKQNHLDKALEVYEEILKKDANNAVAKQKAIEIKSKIAVNSLGGSPKTEVPKAAPKVEAKAEPKKPTGSQKEDSKFTDEDIFSIMDKGAKPTAEKAPTPVLAAKVEPAASAKSKAEEKAPVTSAAFSPAQIDVLKSALSELASINGIKRCFLTSLEGITVVSMGENSNNEPLEKQVLSIFKDTNQSAAKLEQGLLRQVLVTAETGHILLVSFVGGVLVVLADHQINLGMLRLAMDAAAKKVATVK